MTRSLAVEWAKYGIRLMPLRRDHFLQKEHGTDYSGNLQEKFDMRKKVPLRRVGEHQELANLAAFFQFLIKLRITISLWCSRII
jgi:NAD(P)-dependent dehydrogenase (short-subunit alcohol dehydrogenase family)